MSDNIWPGLPTGPNDHKTREQAEGEYNDHLQMELDEQQRLAGELGGSFDARSNFDHNRVEPVGTGEGGRVRINPDNWGSE